MLQGDKDWKNIGIFCVLNSAYIYQTRTILLDMDAYGSLSLCALTVLVLSIKMQTLESLPLFPPLLLIQFYTIFCVDACVCAYVLVLVYYCGIFLI